MAPDCLFCRIVRKEIPANLVHESDDCVAFRDIDPQAPVHILVIPRDHAASLNDISDPAIVGRLAIVAADIARQRGNCRIGLSNGHQHQSRRRTDRVASASAFARRKTHVVASGLSPTECHPDASGASVGSRSRRGSWLWHEQRRLLTQIRQMFGIGADRRKTAGTKEARARDPHHGVPR